MSDASSSPEAAGPLHGPTPQTPFFDRLILRMRGRLPLVIAKLDTMLVYTRGSGEPTAELALSAEVEADSEAALTPNNGKKTGGGDGGAAPEPGSAPPAPTTPVPSSALSTVPLGSSELLQLGEPVRQVHGQGEARNVGLTGGESPRGGRPRTLQITIGRLEIHAAPSEGQPRQVGRSRPGPPVPPSGHTLGLRPPPVEPPTSGPGNDRLRPPHLRSAQRTGFAPSAMRAPPLPPRPPPPPQPEPGGAKPIAPSLSDYLDRRR